MFRLTLFVAAVVIGVALTQTQDPGTPNPAAEDTPVYEMTPSEFDAWLQSLAASEPQITARLQVAALKTVGQPHVADALGEGEYDAADPRPTYALEQSDSASFVSQTLAMALAPDQAGFVALVHRLRYAGGQVATATRNHNILTDWARNNAWLLDDITDQLANGTAWVPVHQVVRKADFLQARYSIASSVPPEKFIGSCIPRVYLGKVLSELTTGDVVLLITGNDRQQYCEEAGVLLVDSSTQPPTLRLVRSCDPQVRQDDFRGLVWNRKDIMGFEFLRLRADAAVAAAAQIQAMQGTTVTP